LPERHALVNPKRGAKIIPGAVSPVRNRRQIHILAHFISTLFTPVAGALSATEVCERIRQLGLRSLRLALAQGGYVVVLSCACSICLAALGAGPATNACQRSRGPG
jgi:hypothetical protein